MVLVCFCFSKDNIPLNLHINGHAEDLRKSPSLRSEDPMSDDNNDIDEDNPSDDEKSAGKTYRLYNTCWQLLLALPT